MTITPPPKKSKAPLRKVSENDTIPTLDSSVVEVCQRVSASQAACPVSLAKRGFAITSYENYKSNRIDGTVSTGGRFLW